MEAQTSLAYIRSQVTLPGENFVKEWTRLSERDKVQMKHWADDEMRVLGIPVRA